MDQPKKEYIYVCQFTPPYLDPDYRDIRAFKLEQDAVEYCKVKNKEYGGKWYINKVKLK